MSCSPWDSISFLGFLIIFDHGNQSPKPNLHSTCVCAVAQRHRSCRRNTVLLSTYVLHRTWDPMYTFTYITKSHRLKTTSWVWQAVIEMLVSIIYFQPWPKIAHMSHYHHHNTAAWINTSLVDQKKICTGNKPFIVQVACTPYQFPSQQILSGKINHTQNKRYNFTLCNTNRFINLVSHRVRRRLICKVLMECQSSFKAPW